MSTVDGFHVGNEVVKYNYEKLENYNTPEFSTSATYAVGDYVMYDGKLYKCKTAITTASAWDVSKWDLAILSDDVSDLKSATSEDLIGSIAWINGYHAFGVGTDAYNLHADANYHCTNYFPVADGVFQYNGVSMSLNDLKSFTGSSSNHIVIFSKNGKIVGWYRNGNKENSDDGDGMSIDFYGSNYALLTVSPNYATLSDVYERTEQNKNAIQFINGEIENNIMYPYYGIGANIFNKNDVVFNDEYYGDDGEIHQYSGYGYSGLIPITGGTTYYFSKPYYFNFYDSSKTFISGGHSSYDGNNTTAPQTAVYLRVSLTEANKDSMMVMANGLPSEYVPFAYQLSDGLKQDFSNLKICCIGDSLTQGVNGDTTDYDVTFIKENYPYYMGKILKNTGILNYGRYGADPITWYNNYKSNFATPDGTYDAALIMLGTNGGISDTLDTDVEPYNSYSDYANTTCGCYCKIIEWLLDVTSNHICIVLVTPPTNWMADRPDKYTVVKNSVEVIKKIAARYSLPVIDVFNDSGISKYQSAIFRPYDGLHFCAKGYHKIGTFIGNQFMSIYSTFDNTDVDTVTGGVNF